MLPPQAPELFNQYKLIRQDENFRQGFIGAHATAQGRKHKKQVSLLAPQPGAGVSWFLKWGEDRGGWVGWGGGVA